MLLMYIYSGVARYRAVSVAQSPWRFPKNLIGQTSYYYVRVDIWGVRCSLTFILAKTLKFSEIIMRGGGKLKNWTFSKNVNTPFIKSIKCHNKTCIRVFFVHFIVPKIFAEKKKILVGP